MMKLATNIAIAATVSIGICALIYAAHCFVVLGFPEPKWHLLRLCFVVGLFWMLLDDLKAWLKTSDKQEPGQ